MERYAPKLMELAPRDMVSRAMYQEIRAGRGIGGKDYVYLDVRHLGRKVIEEKLPDITDFARIYQGVEPLKEPVPVQPTAHYAMGGIPTERPGRGRPRRDEHGRARALRRRRVRLRQRPRRQPPRHQLARGPARLRPAGRPRRWPRYAGGVERPRPIADAVEPVRAELEALRAARRGRVARPPSASELAGRDDGQRRRLPDAQAADRGRWPRSRELRGALRTVSHRRQRDGLQHRPARGPASSATCSTAPRRPSPSALARTESRGAHSREDYPERDDVELAQAHARLSRRGRAELRYKPVTITRFEPKPRTY